MLEYLVYYAWKTHIFGTEYFKIFLGDKSLTPSVFISGATPPPLDNSWICPCDVKYVCGFLRIIKTKMLKSYISGWNCCDLRISSEEKHLGVKILKEISDTYLHKNRSIISISKNRFIYFWYKWISKDFSINCDLIAKTIWYFTGIKPDSLSFKVFE